MNIRCQALLALAAASTLSLLTGCAGSFAPTLSSSQVAGTAVQGNVHGGQQPVVGAHVYLMQAATTGYGAAATDLVGNNGTTGYASDTIGKYVVTLAGGSFLLTGDYTCTSGSQLYLLAEQGNPGLTGPPTPNNTAIGLMGAVGTCTSTGTVPSGVTFVSVNEVSTAVTAYALAGFATDATHISSSSTALAATGLANAFAAVPNLLTVASGVALSATAAGGNGTVPVAEINTLANILASCVNASDPTAGGCPTLFANATADGISTGAKPTETATAAINIAHHPAQAPSALYGLQGSTPPFAPALSATPNDFTVKIYYTGGGLNQSTQLAVDGSGNIWVPSQNNNTLNKFSPLGVALSSATGFTGGGLAAPYAVAIDTSGNAWVTNSSGNSISKFNASGASLAGTTGFTGNADIKAQQIAIDTGGNVWVTNYQYGTVSKLNSAGAEVLNSTAGGAFYNPSGIAIDRSNQVWVADPYNGYTLVLSNSTGNYNSYFFCNGSCDFLELTSGTTPSAWVSDGANGVEEGDSNGNDSVFGGGGLSSSIHDILDGAGNIWVTNGNGIIAEFNSGGEVVTPSTGYTTTLNSTYGIAVDGSGNVWVTDHGTTTGTRLAEFVGAATPTVTPLVQAVINNNIAGKP